VKEEEGRVGREGGEGSEKVRRKKEGGFVRLENSPPTSSRTTAS